MSDVRSKGLGGFLSSTGLGAVALAVAAMTLPVPAFAQDWGARLRVGEPSQAQSAGNAESSSQASGNRGGGFENRSPEFRAERQAERMERRSEWRAQRTENSGGGSGMAMRPAPMPQMSAPVAQAPVMETQRAASREVGGRRGGGGGWQNGQGGQNGQSDGGWRSRSGGQGEGGWRSRNAEAGQPQAETGWRNRNNNSTAGQPQVDNGWRSRNNNTDAGQPQVDNGWRNRAAGQGDNGWRSRNDGSNGQARREGDWRANRGNDGANPHAQAQRRYGEWRYDQTTDSWRSERRNGQARRDQDGWRDGNRWRDGNNRWRDGNSRWGNNSNWRDQRRWDRRWRDNNRYDWHGYRERYRNNYRLGRYYAPYHGYSYRRLGVGFSLGSLFYSDRYWIEDPWQYRLPEVYDPYRWVRYYDDVLLVDIYTGEVVDVIHDFFW